MRHFRIGLLIDPVVQGIDDENAKGNGTDDNTHAHLGLKSLRDKIEAHDAQHHAAGEAQQQTDGAVGILL